MESTFIKSADIQPFYGTDEQYHADKDHISASRLKKIKKSPAHFIEEEEEKESDALLFGSAYHRLILQPEEFEKNYYIFNDEPVCGALMAKGAKSPRSTNDYKAWKESEMSFSDGKILIDKKDYDTIKTMRDRLMSHPYAKMLLSGGVKEQGFMGQIETEAGSINIKFKPDQFNDKKKIVVDLKTTRDASIDGFTRNAADLDYHIQSAFYADMMEKMTGDNRPFNFFFIAQEKKSPYAFNIFEASPQFMSQGRYEYEMLLQLYKYCLDNGVWPGYQIFCNNKYGILELKLPPWAIKDLTYYDHRTVSQKQISQQLVLTP
jgi:hypothetical protein